MKISLVIPTYNTGSNIKPTLEAWGRAHHRSLYNLEIILIDDCSTLPNWHQFLSELETFEGNKNISVRVLRLTKNFGQYFCSAVGLALSEGDIIFIADDDLKAPPEVYYKMLAHLNRQALDFVYISFDEPSPSIVHVTFGRIYNYLIQKLIGYYKTTSNHKVLDAEVRNCFHAGIHPNVFLDFVLLQNGFTHHDYFRVTAQNQTNYSRFNILSRFIQVVKVTQFILAVPSQRTKLFQLRDIILEEKTFTTNS